MKTTMIAGHLTKAEEKALLNEMIEGCPDGYVKDILTDMRPEIENAINSDFVYVDFAARRREATEHEAEMKKTRELLAVIKEEIRVKEQTIKRANNEINNLRSKFEEISRIANAGTRI